MQAAGVVRAETGTQEEPTSEYTQVQRRVRLRTIAVEELQYYSVPARPMRHPIVEKAYALWREVWQSTFLELDGVAELCSDEFTRQDEIGVLMFGARCVSVVGMRWIDLSLDMWRDDSYFKPWPRRSLADLGNRMIGISSNAAVHPDWRGTHVAPPHGSAAEPVRLAYLAVGLTIQRFFESTADCSVAVTRNDRGMNRVCLALGARRLSGIELHGIETDVMHFPKNGVCEREPALDHLWSLRNPR